MKNLFYDEVIYECDLGEMSLMDFLPQKWTKKKQLWNPLDGIKDFTHNYHLKKYFSNNHIIIQSRLERKSPLINMNYEDQFIKIQIRPSNSMYSYFAIPLFYVFILIYARSSPYYYFIPLCMQTIFLVTCYYSLKDTLKTLKHDLELEFRYQKIKYDVKDGETYYPTS